MKIPSSKALLLSLANLALLRPASAFNLTRQAQVARQVQVIQDQFRMASTSEIAQEDMNGEQQLTIMVWNRCSYRRIHTLQSREPSCNNTADPSWSPDGSVTSELTHSPPQ